MRLFFDTETTGIPRNYKAPVSDLQNWPRLVQIAWVLADDEANEIESVEYLVRPNGFTIPKDATRIHGITTEMAAENGVDLEFILDAFTTDIKKASTHVAHNVQFDEKILGAEFLRAGLTNPFKSASRKCTMQAATNYCRLPGPYGYKWPSLQELHMKLFNEHFEGEHRALADARACARCYFELRRFKFMA